MRKSFKWFFAAALCASVAIGCAKQGDLDKIVERVDGIENRVGALENAVKQLNETDVPGLKTLVSALQRQITVASVVEDEDGYVITFSDGSVAVLRNGKNGKDGTDGVDGVDGRDGVDGKDGEDATTPTVGIKLVNGVYYWTVNGQLLLDDTGYPIPVTGNDGTDGTDGKDGVDGKDGITPLFGILDGHWVVSYDNGDNWKTLGLTSDTDYSAYIDPDKETDDYIVLVVGATEVQIPKEKAFTLSFTIGDNNGVDAGTTKTFPYTISGVNPSDEVDVDVIGIMGDWKAEIVPSNNSAGGLKVTATESESAKITVYAANHKGKADIRTIVFEAGVLEGIYEAKDIDWEGGELDLAVKTNQKYNIFIPIDGEDWITVEPVTRVYVDNYKINVAKNETGAYRQSTLQLLNTAGKIIKKIEVLQYANPAVATDLSSVVDLPDGKAVTVKGVTVVAASKASTIITDGVGFCYVPGYVGTAGTVVNLSGTKKTDKIGAAYIDEATVTVDAEGTPAEVDKKANYIYYGYGSAGLTFFYTANNGVVSEKDGVYYVTGFMEPQQFVIEDPTQDLSGLVGKMVAMSGWVKAVDTANDAEDIVTILTDIKEVVWAQEAGWTLSYGGPNSGETGYPELIINTVASPEAGSNYTLSVFDYAKIAAEYESLSDFIIDACYNASDNLLFNLSYYSSYGYDYVFSVFAHNETAADSFKDFGYGQFVILATGLDDEGRLTGKFNIGTFEKESPYAKASYEDFLGEWTYTSEAGTETWLIEENVKGESYKISGLDMGLQPNGKEYPVAAYDAETGSFTLSNQLLGSWTYSGATVTDYLVAVWYNSQGIPSDNSSYMTDPLICTAYMLKDGSAVQVVPSSDSYGALEGFAIFVSTGDGSYLRYTKDGAYCSTPIPGTLVKSQVQPEAGYAQWLGKWNVDRQKKVYSNNEWVLDGEPVTDTWTIAAKQVNKTFVITGIYGRDKFQVTANYDSETHAFSVPLQDNVGAIRFQGDDYDCTVNFQGAVLRPNGSNSRITGNYNIFTAQASSADAATLTPGTVTITSWGPDPVPLSMGRFYALDPQDGKTYTFGDQSVFLNLPNTMKRAASGSSVNYAPDYTVAREFNAALAVSTESVEDASVSEAAPEQRPEIQKTGRKNFCEAFPKAVKF